MNNNQRADSIDPMVALFARTVGITLTCKSDILADLLTNLMHWSDRNNVNFAERLKVAKTHYKAEIK